MTESGSKPLVFDAEQAFQDRSTTQQALFDQCVYHMQKLEEKMMAYQGIIEILDDMDADGEDNLIELFNNLLHRLEMQHHTMGTWMKSVHSDE